jgi:hypothetical protein
MNKSSCGYGQIISGNESETSNNIHERAQLFFITQNGNINQNQIHHSAIDQFADS